MASQPYPDKRRNIWCCKYRPDPTGPWVIANLGKHPIPFGSKGPPKKPPQFAIDRRNELAEIEYRAKKGIGKTPVREKGLAVHLADYLRTYPLGHDAGSVKQMERHARSFEAFATARRVTTLQGVTKALCRSYLEQRSAAGVGHDTLVTEKGYLSGVWARAVEDELVPDNPWRKVKPPGSPSEPEWTFWSDDEVARIAAACHKAWQSDLVLVLANTGLRISAGLAMEWRWLDWERGLVKVPAVSDKGGRGYAIPWTATTREVLTRRFANRHGDSPLVFPNLYRDGGVVPYDSARAAIMRAIARAKVKPGTPHDLRHTFARWLVRQPGIPLNVVQAALGHANLKTTQRYLAMGGDDMRGMFDEIGLGGGGATVKPDPLAAVPSEDTPRAEPPPTT